MGEGFMISMVGTVEIGLQDEVYYKGAGPGGGGRGAGTCAAALPPAAARTYTDRTPPVPAGQRERTKPSSPPAPPMARLSGLGFQLSRRLHRATPLPLPRQTPRPPPPAAVADTRRPEGSGPS